MNGFVTIEAGVFTGSGFAMELKSAVTEVTKTAAVSKMMNLNFSSSSFVIRVNHIYP